MRAGLEFLVQVWDFSGPHALDEHFGCDERGSPNPGSRPWSGLEGWAPDLLKSQVYEQLLLDVILGVLPPGERLEEQALTHRYGAGLAGVREALGRLSLEGLVIRKARAGTTVAALDPLEVLQTLQVRRLVEPHGAELAAQYASPEDVAALNRAFDGAEAAIEADDRRALIRMDQEFHLQIARASGNPTLARILGPLQHKVSRFWACSGAASSKSRNRADIDAHRCVARCIASRDARGASAAVLKGLGALRIDLERVAAGATAPMRSSTLSIA